jgi:hypothetical protein
LFFFDRNEQSFEIAFAKAFTAFALENFVEHCRTIFDRFAEYLEQIAFVVAIEDKLILLLRFSMSDFYQHSQSFVNGYRIRKRFLHVRFQQDQVRSGLIPLGIFAARFTF